MSPVPEPTQGSHSGPNGRDDEEFTPPVGLIVGPMVSSSDEEADQANVDDSYPAGYQLLPQDNDMDEDLDDAEIDYSSISSLMAAVNTNGPNVVPSEEEHTEAGLGNEERGEGSGEEVRVAPHAVTLAEEPDRERQSEQSCERAAVWNESSSTSDRLVLDGNKLEEIKTVMASFTLPQSAIPPWAHNLSEEEWKDQVFVVISRRTSK
ncbi:male-enhanced antigen 1-like [Homarus americanus]|uniref:Male-enhanced antigen 1 n=1 Tax=Homarus americanus TaxID=6706 RepID=A0A8J5JNG4_HOMAM|nr:male-enhanced antigen 1-like [Homarus americanus]XP_042242416.1 male-enhanced antigen 1-like [Homarus americanus]XP_042242417.1 male-enhanced antigen 1-like [Homarus americanus]KAG7157738.1 putative Male enhanced antigen 1 (MEA1)-containing protein [Homarus americanus]